jgi:hypothetical protein
MCTESEFSVEKLYERLLTALRSWKNLHGTSTTLLTDLLLVRQRQQHLKLENPSTIRLATNQVLLEAIDALGKQDLDGTQVLRDRFLEGETMKEIAHRQKRSIDQVKRAQKNAVLGLAQLIGEWENRLREAHSAAMLEDLPPPSYEDGRLFGVEPLYKNLVEQLEAPNAPWVISLTGIGGIGKTALADLLTRRIIHCFIYERIIWLRVNRATPLEHLLYVLKEKLLNDTEATAPVTTAQKKAIREQLKRKRTLIIIDNLEQIDDPLRFYQTLNDLANPSKFLLTSRLHPPEIADAYTQSLSDISFEAAVELLRELSARRGLLELGHAPQPTYQAIYDVVGGNPLALRLIIGLCNVFPLPQILTDLTQAHITQVSEMYLHIYWKAWHALTEPAQSMLLMMPMAARTGMNLAQMLAVSQLSHSQLAAAIGELSNRSLLEIRGTLHERRYGIHSLTESFLKTEIINWPKESL